MSSYLPAVHRDPVLPALSLLVVFLPSLLLGGCSVAEMAVAPQLASQATPLAVTGANPRTWGQPLAFGPWVTSANRDGTELSWAFQAFGVGFGSARRPYSFLLEGDGGEPLEAACLTRDLRLFRGSFEVDVTGAFTPALACAVRPVGAGAASTLTLATHSGEYRGHAELTGGPVLDVRSTHRFAGSSLPSSEPVGYELLDGGRVVAAVETVNRGRVWLAPDLPAPVRSRVAAVAAALLLFDPTA